MYHKIPQGTLPCKSLITGNHSASKCRYFSKATVPKRADNSQLDITSNRSSRHNWDRRGMTPHAASRCRTDNTSGHRAARWSSSARLPMTVPTFQPVLAARSHQHSASTALPLRATSVGSARSLNGCPTPRAPRSSSSPAPSDGICSQRATSKFEGPRRRSCPMARTSC